MIATLTDTIQIVITNILKADDYRYSHVGKRTVMSLAKAKDLGIADFEFLLNAVGNFMKFDDATQTAVEYADGDNVNGALEGEKMAYDDQVAVVARVATKANDRYIQFFATQQKILLAPGDQLTFNVKTAAEAAHYRALAVDGEITVEITTIDEEAKVEDATTGA